MVRYGTWVILTAVVATLMACGPVVVSQKAELDTPARHVDNGIRLLHLGKVGDAFREFTRARELDPKYPAAYVGLGLCYGLQGDYQKGIDTMKEAESFMLKEDQ